VNPIRQIADYSTLVQVRQRRGQQWEQELRALVRQHQQAQDEQALCAQQVDQADQSLRDYADRLAQRTAAHQRVLLTEVQGARMHCEQLARQCQSLRKQLADKASASAQAEARCVAQRQRMVRNLQRIDALRTQRDKVQTRLQSQREAREEDERDDSPRRSGLAPLA
jgi:chromosome segregation ATPase